MISNYADEFWFEQNWNVIDFPTHSIGGWLWSLILFVYLLTLICIRDNKCAMLCKSVDGEIGIQF